VNISWRWAKDVARYAVNIVHTSGSTLDFWNSCKLPLSSYQAELLGEAPPIDIDDDRRISELLGGKVVECAKGTRTQLLWHKNG